MTTIILPEEHVRQLAVLPEEIRQVVVLYYGLEGNPALSIEAIAEIQRAPDVDTSLTRARLLRGVGMLREAHDAAVRFNNARAFVESKSPSSVEKKAP